MLSTKNCLLATAIVIALCTCALAQPSLPNAARGPRPATIPRPDTAQQLREIASELKQLREQHAQTAQLLADQQVARDRALVEPPLWTDKWLVGIGFGGVLLTFCTFIALVLQVRANVAAAEATRLSADAAKDSADVAKRTLILTQRARLHVLLVSKDGKDVNPTFTVEVVNHGRLPARVSGWSIGVMDEEFADIPDGSLPQHMASGAIVAPNGGRGRLDAMVDFKLPQDEWKQVINGIRPLTVWGTISYDTGFSEVAGELGFGFEYDVAMNHEGSYWKRFTPTSAPNYNYSN